MSYKTYSRFGRDAQVYLHVVDSVLYTSARRAVAAGEKSIRIWSVGCAGGEEPYSLAIAWHCALSEFFPSIQLNILATDIDGDALERADKGAYTAHAVANLPIEWVATCFDVVTKSDGQAVYVLRSAVKASVRFEHADVRQRIPFEDGPFSILMCRYSVFLYLSSDDATAFLRQATSPACLKDEGLLITGLSDQLPQGSAVSCGLAAVCCDEISHHENISERIHIGGVPKGIYRKVTSTAPLECNDGLPDLLSILLARRRKARALQQKPQNVRRPYQAPSLPKDYTKTMKDEEKKAKSKYQEDRSEKSMSKKVIVASVQKKAPRTVPSDPNLFKPRLLTRSKNKKRAPPHVPIVPPKINLVSNKQINVRLPRVATLPPRKLVEPTVPKSEENIKPLKAEEMEQLISRIAKNSPVKLTPVRAVPEEDDDDGIVAIKHKLTAVEAQRLVDRMMADAVRREQEMAIVMEQLQTAYDNPGPVKLTPEEISSFVQRMDADAKSRAHSLQQAQSRLLEIETQGTHSTCYKRRDESYGIDGLRQLAAFRNEHVVQLSVRPTELVQFLLKKQSKLPPNRTQSMQSRQHWQKHFQERILYSEKLFSNFARVQGTLSHITSPRSFASKLASLDEISEVKTNLKLGTVHFG